MYVIVEPKTGSSAAAPSLAPLDINLRQDKKITIPNKAWRDSSSSSSSSKLQPKVKQKSVTIIVFGFQDLFSKCHPEAQPDNLFFSSFFPFSSSSSSFLFLFYLPPRSFFILWNIWTASKLSSCSCRYWPVLCASFLIVSSIC